MIEYCGDGNDVEVTGSFNGWQHRVGMELQANKANGLVLVLTLSTYWLHKNALNGVYNHNPLIPDSPCLIIVCQETEMLVDITLVISW